MAQFMDSSVSPIKMKIWGTRGWAGGAGMISSQEEQTHGGPSTNLFNPHNTPMRWELFFPFTDNEPEHRDGKSLGPRHTAGKGKS